MASVLSVKTLRRSSTYIRAHSMLMSEGDRLIRDLAAADSHDNADMIVKKKKK